MQQSFARGRSKSVVVEKKRKRVVGPQSGGNPAAPGKPQPGATQRKGETPLAAKARELGLSEEELVARQRAIQRARAEAAQKDEKRKEAEAERSKRAEEEQRLLEAKQRREAEELADAERRKLVRNGEERIIREIKLQFRPAIGRKPRIVIAVAVFVCIRIVAAGDGKFSALVGIGIVPAVRRSIRVGRIPQPLRRLLGQVLNGISGDAVSRLRV